MLMKVICQTKAGNLKMPVLSDHDREHLRKHFETLADEVTVTMFTQEFECPYCKDTRELLQEVAALNPKIRLGVYDCVDKIPVIIVAGKKPYRMRFFGIPAGYEFVSLMEAIIDASKGTTSLSQTSKDRIRRITKPVHIQVFVTTTCPYCPSMVRLAHQLAVESELVTADMIEGMEFPHLAYKYGVMGVPKTIINETFEVVGAVPEEHFVNRVIQVANSATPSTV
jgi:glutaredoxin-like protein